MLSSELQQGIVCAKMRNSQNARPTNSCMPASLRGEVIPSRIKLTLAQIHAKRDKSRQRRTPHPTLPSDEPATQFSIILVVLMHGSTVDRVPMCVRCRLRYCRVPHLPFSPFRVVKTWQSSTDVVITRQGGLTFIFYMSISGFQSIECKLHINKCLVFNRFPKRILLF